MENGLLEVWQLPFRIGVCTDKRVGAADPATHKIYIWDISNDGQFASALDGGREPLVDLHVCDIFRQPSYNPLDPFSLSLVAPIKVLDCLHDEPWQHFDLALPES